MQRDSLYTEPRPRRSRRLLWCAAVVVLTPLILIAGTVALVGALTGVTLRGALRSLPPGPRTAPLPRPRTALASRPRVPVEHHEPGGAYLLEGHVLEPASGDLSLSSVA